MNSDEVVSQGESPNSKTGPHDDSLYEQVAPTGIASKQERVAKYTVLSGPGSPPAEGHASGTRLAETPVVSETQVNSTTHFFQQTLDPTLHAVSKESYCSRRASEKQGEVTENTLQLEDAATHVAAPSPQKRVAATTTAPTPGLLNSPFATSITGGAISPQFLNTRLLLDNRVNALERSGLGLRPHSITRKTRNHG